MSPEQLRSSRDVDDKADIWALGVILYEMLSGREPFTADTLPQLCAMILEQPPPSLRSLRAQIPAELERVVFRCLEKAPSARFSSVAELSAALAPFGSDMALASAERAARSLRRTGQITGSILPPPSASHTVTIRPPASTTTQRRIAAGGALVAAVAAAIVIRACDVRHPNMSALTSTDKPIAQGAIALAAAPSNPPSTALASPPPTPLVAPAATPSHTGQQAASSALPVPAAPARSNRAAALVPVHGAVTSSAERPSFSVSSDNFGGRK
jgi:serine/threonine-protein kinase